MYNAIYLLNIRCTSAGTYLVLIIRMLKLVLQYIKTSIYMYIIYIGIISVLLILCMHTILNVCYCILIHISVTWSLIIILNKRVLKQR